MQQPTGRALRSKASQEQEGGPNWKKWTNVFLYWQANKKLADKQAAMKAQIPPPKVNITGKLTPEQQAQMLQSQAGIQTDPSTLNAPNEMEQETIQRADGFRRLSSAHGGGCEMFLSPSLTVSTHITCGTSYSGHYRCARYDDNLVRCRNNNHDSRSGCEVKDQLIGLVLRHGETDLNDANRFRSWIDVPLNQKGLEQARDAAKFLKKFKLTNVISSPLLRAFVTADFAAGLQNLTVFQHRGLFPWRLGVFSGLPRKENNDALRLFVKNPDVTVPGGESLRDFEDRQFAFWNAALKKARRTA